MNLRQGSILSFIAIFQLITIMISHHVAAAVPARKDQFQQSQYHEDKKLQLRYREEEQSETEMEAERDRIQKEINNNEEKRYGLLWKIRYYISKPLEPKESYDEPVDNMDELNKSYDEVFARIKILGDQLCAIDNALSKKRLDALWKMLDEFDVQAKNGKKQPIFM